MRSKLADVADCVVLVACVSVPLIYWRVTGFDLGVGGFIWSTFVVGVVAGIAAWDWRHSPAFWARIRELDAMRDESKRVLDEINALHAQLEAEAKRD